MQPLRLLPMPRKVVPRDGMFVPHRDRHLVQLDRATAPQLTAAGKILQQAARESFEADWQIVAEAANAKNAAVTVLLRKTDREQYTIDLQPQQILITASTPAMAFYAAQTIGQLFRQFKDAVPCMHIEDWPDFANRGVMLDISRDKVPTMQTLFELVDLFASLKINQLQLYTEHTFAYRAHREVWAEASPMTGQQIEELDAYCRQRFIELVPNQNCFGHMERWLKHEKYKPLAECPDGFTFPWGQKFPGGFSLDPQNPGSLQLIESLFDELLPHFTSRQFNVGCDETFDLGQGKSMALVEARGRERVYLDFLLKIHRAVQSHGRRMMFWGDIILHRPELIPELPEDVIALNWGYELGHPFEKETRAFQQAGVPFYVCPGTASWCTIVGRTHNAMSNLKDAAEQGLKHGAIGYLNTDWGDYGHLQYLPVSYLGFAAGAAMSWCNESNRDLPIGDVLSLHIFRDRANVMGQLMVDLGNVYRVVQGRQYNSSALFWSLVGDETRKHAYEIVTRAEADESEKLLNEIEQRLAGARIDRPDAKLIDRETRNGIAMLKHGCKRARWRIDASSENPAKLAADLLQLIHEHQELWLARNRPGGLIDSTKRLSDRLADYE